MPKAVIGHMMNDNVRLPVVFLAGHFPVMEYPVLRSLYPAFDLPMPRSQINFVIPEIPCVPSHEAMEYKGRRKIDQKEYKNVSQNVIHFSASPSIRRVSTLERYRWNKALKSARLPLGQSSGRA